MISNIALRRLNVSHSHALPIRWMSSIQPPVKKSDDEAKQQQRRSLHQSVHQKQADTADPTSFPMAKTAAANSSWMDRWVVTAEVTVSKIFPAGFGWQTASIIADAQGLTGMDFAVATGIGDAVGVLGGHFLYYTAKQAILTDSKINLQQELHSGMLLGTAAFCSGTVWQPVVNILQGANLSFATVVTGTAVTCGTAFYVGLRLGRTLLPLHYVEEPTHENSQTDMALSVAIGGATGFFVGTDMAYLPSQNFLIGVVGIADGTPDMVGAAIAGTSTALGFMSTQSVMNIIYPAGKCWND